jgi:sugar phosphate isomerase/epimerase
VFKNLNLGAIGHSAPFESACALARAHGFQGIDLDAGFLLGKARASSLDAVKEWFAATGLRPGGFGLSAKFRESDSAAAFEESLTAVAEEARLAAALGATRCMTWVMPASNSLNFREHWNLVIPRLSRAAALLASHGIRLGLEFIGPATLRAGFKQNFVHSMDAMLAACLVIGPNAGLLLDCYHAYTAHVTADDLMKLSNHDVVYVHVNDAVAGRGPDEQIDQEREMTGASGVIDIAAFAKALKTIGYDGPVTVEPFNKAVKAMVLDEAVALTSKSLDLVVC